MEFNEKMQTVVDKFKQFILNVEANDGYFVYRLDEDGKVIPESVSLDCENTYLWNVLNNLCTIYFCSRIEKQYILNAAKVERYWVLIPKSEELESLFEPDIVPYHNQSMIKKVSKFIINK